MNMQELRNKEGEAARRLPEQGDRDTLHALLSQVDEAERKRVALIGKAEAAETEAGRLRGELQVTEGALERAVQALEEAIAEAMK